MPWRKMLTISSWESSGGGCPSGITGIDLNSRRKRALKAVFCKAGWSRMGCWYRDSLPVGTARWVLPRSGPSIV